MFLFGGVTTIDVERTSDVLAIWLKVPPLIELSWQRITSMIPDIGSVPASTLIQMGIPTGLVERISS